MREKFFNKNKLNPKIARHEKMQDMNFTEP